MEILTKEYNDMECKHQECVVKSRPSLRISSAYSFPSNNLAMRGAKDWIAEISVGQDASEIPAFKIGPCPLLHKGRELKSAYPGRFSIRNLALSFRAGRYKRREVVELEKSSFKEDNQTSTTQCREKYNDNDNTLYEKEFKGLSLEESHSDTSKKMSSVIDSSNVDNNNSKDIKRFYENSHNNEDNKATKETHEKNYIRRKKKLRQLKIGRKQSSVPVSRKISLKMQSKKRGVKEDLQNNNDHRSTKAPLKIINMMKTHKPFVKSNLKPNEGISQPNLQSTSPIFPRKLNNSPGHLSKNLFINSIENQFPESHNAPRCTKIYLSEKHSHSIMGIPAAPPGTPGLELQPHLEFIASLSDIKSQRLVASKLNDIASKQSKKEQQERKMKEQQLQLIEKRKQKEMQTKIKERQRAEIYALNKILTEIENAAYENSKKTEGMPV